MTKEQIDKLFSEGTFPEHSVSRELTETHISWVFLCDTFVYKIKKPIRYSFLDFSTIEKRKFYCEREIELNKRLTNNIYLDVLPVRQTSGKLQIGDGNGEVIDYVVRMRRMQSDRQMDKLLSNNQVTEADVRNLAKKIAAFHKSANIVYQKDILDISEKFNDLLAEGDYLENNLNIKSAALINCAINASNIYMEKNKELLASRLKAGLFRDCHGDLHSRNIFLLPSPQPFDCIEFNDDYRQIDVLNEVAFLCMDLDAFGRENLSVLFLNYYNTFFPAMNSDADQNLFIYYKSYRANIRAKINSLRARDAKTVTEKQVCLREADKYLCLMDAYIQKLKME